jgi:hypothetical protein
MGYANRLGDHVFAELYSITVVKHLCLKDALLDHEGPLGGSVDEVLHFTRSVEVHVSSVHGFPAKQAQAINMAKVSVGEQHVIDPGLTPNRQLLTQKTSCLNQVICLAIRNPKSYRVGRVFWSEVHTTGARAAGLRPTTVLC